MRRLFLLCLLVLTSLQLAVAGLPTAATVAPACHGFSFDMPVSAAQPAAGDPAEVCALCGLCKTCHQAAISVDQVFLTLAGPLRNGFPRLATSYRSADHFPSLKPPIG